ncbi:hypothetical protein PQQ51_27995 [Paraburkholderia xenovorans]|uniref:hypothetical protein n=1 Tax=Paraburkholderia xenovorans TaxID=36873 RepID=UPI0038BA267A
MDNTVITNRPASSTQIPSTLSRDNESLISPSGGPSPKPDGQGQPLSGGSGGNKRKRDGVLEGLPTRNATPEAREAKKLRTGPAIKRDLAAPVAELGAYLTAKAALGEHVEGTPLKDLCLATTAMESARTNFPFGPGNVTQALRQYNHEGGLRTDAAKHPGVGVLLTPFGDHRLPELFASASLTQAGSCGEFAAHTAVRALERLNAQPPRSALDDRLVEMVTHTDIDHGWAQLSPANPESDAPSVAMDAWSIGAAVLSTDGRFSRQPENTEVDEFYTAEDLPGLKDDITEHRSKMAAAMPEYAETLASLREENFSAQQGTDGLWDATTTVSEQFASRARARMTRASVVPPALVESAALRTAASQRDVANELHATVALHSIGVPISTAAAQANEVAERAKRLDEVPPGHPWGTADKRGSDN